MDLSNKVLWVITEGLKGTENPCLGVAQALGISPIIKQIQIKQPWKLFCPYLGFEQQNTFYPKLNEPWPDILITNGRKSLAAARYIKKESQGKTFTVHLQDPKIKAPFLDLIAAPKHDQVNTKNSIETLATPNLINQINMDQAKKDFPEFAKYTSPRVAVLIGGKSKAYDLPEQTTKTIIDQLQNLSASLLVTCSRRTGSKNSQMIIEALEKSENYIWDNIGKNPYIALLAWSDYILVTADSTSMISESCSTGKPVFIIDLPGGTKRIDRFHNNLISYGALKIFDGSLHNYKYEPPNDARKVAQEIKKLLKAFT